VIRRHNALVRKAVAEHGGFEVKALGDGFMLVFPSATRALRCAREIRERVAAEPPLRDGTRVRVRIGVHTGEPIAEDGDFYGSQVNLAARVAGQADGGQILVSDLTRRLVAHDAELRFGEEREVELKGFAGRQRVVELT
jgi:class 3 adenylate cyclase